ncbi:MAG: hypothetical protein ABFS35_13290 [Bacteroidota bacterium]
MIYIKQFNFIEKIATKGLDEFYKKNYSDEFILANYREGVKIETILLQPIENSWDIINKKDYPSNKLKEIDWHFDSIQEPFLPVEISIQSFLNENNLLQANTIFDWIAVKQHNFGDVKYKVHIRHFEQNPVKFTKQAKFELFFMLYFDYQFESLFDFLVREINNEPNEFSDFEKREPLSFYDILIYESKIEKVFEDYNQTQRTQYKEKIYEDLIKRVEELFLYLKNEFPIMYNNLLEKHPQELENIYKLRWYPKKDIFFLLFNELKEAAFIRNHKGNSLKYDELSRILMKIFEISPEKGQNSEYTPQSFEKRLQNPISDWNREPLLKIKKLVKEFVMAIKDLR